VQDAAVLTRIEPAVAAALGGGVAVDDVRSSSET
jgi:hypothetical protein